MANAIYGKTRKAFLDKKLELLVDNIKVVLVDAGAYTPSIDVDDFFDDIPSVIATSANLTTKITDLGIFGADPITFSSVTGVESEYLVIYHDTGTAATSELIALIDTATGLPVQPNGGDITVTWQTTGDKIFKI